MPLPKTKNIGKIIEFLKKEKPNMSKKQRIAIALNVAGKSKKKGGKKMAKKTKKIKRTKKIKYPIPRPIPPKKKR